MTSVSVFEIAFVVVVACEINRVFVEHDLTLDNGYATHHSRLCHWVICFCLALKRTVLSYDEFVLVRMSVMAQP